MEGAVRFGAILSNNGDVVLVLLFTVKGVAGGDDAGLGVDGKLVVVWAMGLDAVGDLEHKKLI